MSPVASGQRWTDQVVSNSKQNEHFLFFSPMLGTGIVNGGNIRTQPEARSASL
jgi:hypothetical protein